MQHHRLPAIQQVNGDVLYKNNPSLTQFDVATLVQQQIKQYCTARESFSLESNLATESSYSIVDFARKNSYQIVLHFLALDSPIRCRSRVEDRITQGGHDVPFPIIEQRYQNGLSLIKQHYARFDEIMFIDNSLESFRTVLQIQKGIIVHQGESLPTLRVSVGTFNFGNVSSAKSTPIPYMWHPSQTVHF